MCSTIVHQCISKAPGFIDRTAFAQCATKTIVTIYVYKQASHTKEYIPIGNQSQQM